MVWSFEVSIQADHHEQKDLSHTLSLSAYCLPVSRLIVKEHNPRRKRPRFDQFQVRPVPISKEPLPAPQHHRVDQQPVVIDQIMLPQRLDKLTAAADQNVLAGLLFQLRDLFRDIPLNQPRIVPRDLLQRGRNNVLGNAVHSFTKLTCTGHGWPGGCEPLVVTRPSSSASLANSSSNFTFPISSCQYAIDQPPCTNFSAPPGSSITPSSVTNSETTIFLIQTPWRFFTISSYSTIISQLLQENVLHSSILFGLAGDGKIA